MVARSQDLRVQGLGSRVYELALGFICRDRNANGHVILEEQFAHVMGLRRLLQLPPPSLLLLPLLG